MSQAWWPLHPVGDERPPGTLSVEEWAALPEDTDGELVDGRIEEEEVADWVHELAISWLIHVVRVWLNGQGFVAGSESAIALAPRHGRKPDMVVVLPGSRPPPFRGPLRRPPDILVEVVTPTPRDERRDRVQKFAEYAKFGVPWYWVLDPALGSFEVFQLENGRYARAGAATEGKFDVPGCPGLTIDLDALWRNLRRLGPEEPE